MASSRLVAALAAAWTALAAIASSGTIAFGSNAGPRIGIVPTDAPHLLVALGAGAVVLAIGWRARGFSILAAVAPLALVLLPWLPLPVPAAFLVWTGALSSLVWLAVAAALAAVSAPRVITYGAYGVERTPARRNAIAAGVLSALVFGAAAWGASPSIPGGDEPHYLVITQSLLYDHDLKIENNHRRGDYHAYYAGDLQPDSIRHGRNGEIYSIHAPGVPALVLPAFAVGGYHGVVVFLILFASAGCALAWWLAWRASGSIGAAWFGWAVVTTCAPFLLESYTVFPDGPGAVVVLTGFWALLRAEWEGSDRGQTGVRPGSDPAPASPMPTSWVPWLFHGLALATLPWMHTRFAVLAGTLGGLILVRIARTPNPLAKAIAFLLPAAASALAWLFFFAIVYGTPDPSAPYGRDTQISLAFFPNGVGGLLFDQGFGLLATAPVLVFALAGFVRARRLALEWLVVALPYLLAVATYAMWWAGLSGPARFLVPLLLPLSIPAARAWASARSPGTRVVMLSALVLSAWLAAVMAGGGDGRLGYHTRNEAGATAAPWMDWANHVVDLPAAFPAFVPQPVQPDPGGLVSRRQATQSGFAALVPWAACLGGAAALLIWGFSRRRYPPETMIAGATMILATAAMVAMSIVWKMHAAEPVTTTAAQMNVLRRLAGGRVAALDLTSRRRMPLDEASAMRIEVPVRRGRGSAPRNRPLAAFPAVPAGSYVMSVRRTGVGDGWVMVGVGNDQFAIVTQPIAAFDAGIRIELPVDVRALIVRADEGARDQLQAVELRPVAVSGARRTARVARRAVRYETGLVFFFDDQAYPEPSGFWVGGGRQTTVAIACDRPGTTAGLTLHNAPVRNRVVLESGNWREELALEAGEERRIDVPVDASTKSALLRIRSESGFRPSEADPKSRDSRFLGVYVRTP